MVTAIPTHSGSGPKNTARNHDDHPAMMPSTDKHVSSGKDLGWEVPGWTGAAPPAPCPVEGRFCRIEPLRLDHAPDLHHAYLADTDGIVWDYLPYGPFDSLRDFTAFLTGACLGSDPLFYAIVDLASGRAVGMASYLRIDPLNGVIEVGHINYSPALQRTPAATEVMFLMMRQVFDAWGYRRYEWKCNDLNERSKHAARRLGFTFEGVFRQAVVSKGRNRDTAWFSILDSEWPAARAAFASWLDEANFTDDGRQRAGLAALRACGGR